MSSHLTGTEYDEFLQLARSLAREAGFRIKQTFNQESSPADEQSIEYKGLIDLVTKTDKEVENYIISTIRNRYPDHEFLAEESYKGGAYNFTDKPTWIIDPIDGTTNFVHKYPFVCVSIGFSINKRVVVGVVYNPVLEEFYEGTTFAILIEYVTAVRGHGSFLNGKRMNVSGYTSLHKCVVATNVGYDRSEEGADFMLGNIRRLLMANVQSMRSEGTSAVDLSGVALGRLDCFYEYGVHPWDIAAGSLLVEEAGGIVVDPLFPLDHPQNTPSLNLENRRVLGGNKQVVALVWELLQKVTVPEKWTHSTKK